MTAFIITLIIVLIIIIIKIYVNPKFDYIVNENCKKRIIWFNIPKGRTYVILWTIT